jgi:hypothetical protein
VGGHTAHPWVTVTAAEVAALTGETKTGAIRAALGERLSRLTAADDSDRRKERFV